MNRISRFLQDFRHRKCPVCRLQDQEDPSIRKIRESGDRIAQTITDILRENSK